MHAHLRLPRIRVVWRYTFLDPVLNTLTMPKGATLLNLGEQGNEACMWMLVDPEAEKEQRQFLSVPSGVEFEASDTTYLGTAHMTEKDGTPFVVHIFEHTR